MEIEVTADPAFLLTPETFTQSMLEKEGVNPEIVKYLNRLSDLLFVMARVGNARASIPDVPWVQEAV